MVAVAAYEVTGVIENALGKLWRVVPELPPRDVVEHKKAQFIAGIHKGWVLRTVGVADDFKSSIAQLFGIAPVQTVGHGISHYGKILVAVGTDERMGIGLAIEPESICALKFHTAYAKALTVAIDNATFLVKDTHKELIELRILGRPKGGLFEREAIDGLHSLPWFHGEFLVDKGCLTPVGLQELIFHNTRKSLTALVAHLQLQAHLGRGVADMIVGHEQATARHGVFDIGVGDMKTVVRHKPAVAIDATEIGVIKHFLLLARRI